MPYIYKKLSKGIQYIEDKYFRKPYKLQKFNTSAINGSSINFKMVSSHRTISKDPLYK